MNERRYILDTEQHRDNAARFIGKLDVAKPVEIIVRDYIAHRTTNQNARLWALHSLAAQHTGHAPDEMHEFALMRHFGYTEQSLKFKDGEVITRRIPLKRSSQRNKAEFARFMEATEAWYIDEFGVWFDQQRAA